MSAPDNSVKRVILTVKTKDGGEHTLVQSSPLPPGDNPRFMSQQFHYAVRHLSAQMDSLLDGYAEQIR